MSKLITPRLLTPRANKSQHRPRIPIPESLIHRKVLSNARPPLDELPIARCQSSANLFAVDNHRHKQGANRECNAATDDEHVGKTHRCHPRNDGKSDTNGDGISQESNTDEGFGDKLAISIDDEGEGDVAVSTESESKECSTEGGIDPVHALKNVSERC